MGESFLIFFAIIVGTALLIALILAIILGAVILRWFIVAAFMFLISASLFGGGLTLLFKFGGVLGAFGLLLTLPGALFGWIGFCFAKLGLQELKYLRS
jgi:hypothetical protein